MRFVRCFHLQEVLVCLFIALISFVSTVQTCVVRDSTSVLAFLVAMFRFTVTSAVMYCPSERLAGQVTPNPPIGVSLRGAQATRIATEELG